jgi:hypothetical protein
MARGRGLGCSISRACDIWVPRTSRTPTTATRSVPDALHALPEAHVFPVVVLTVARDEGGQWSPAADVFHGGTCLSFQVRFKLVGNLVNVTLIEGVIRGVDGALNVASNNLSFEFDALHNAGTSGFFQVGPGGMQS